MKYWVFSITDIERTDKGSETKQELEVSGSHTMAVRADDEIGKTIRVKSHTFTGVRKGFPVGLSGLGYVLYAGNPVTPENPRGDFALVVNIIEIDSKEHADILETLDLAFARDDVKEAINRAGRLLLGGVSDVLLNVITALPALLLGKDEMFAQHLHTGIAATDYGIRPGERVRQIPIRAEKINATLQITRIDEDTEAIDGLGNQEAAEEQSDPARRGQRAVERVPGQVPAEGEGREHPDLVGVGG